MPGVVQKLFPGATDMSMVPCYVGLDYHEKSIRICAIDEDGLVVMNRDVPNNPTLVMLTVARVSDEVLGVAIEACCGAADFAARLETLSGWPIKLAHAGAVRCLKKTRDKSDHGDAWHLADLIRVKFLPEVWLADEKTRQLRRLVSYRNALVAERKNVKLRIRGLLREERILSTGRAWTKPWMEWLRVCSMREESRWVLDQEILRLTQLDEAIQGVEQRFVEATRGDTIVEKLLEQQEVGLVTAVGLRAVIGRFDRFRKGKQLSSYCGITPCNASSGRRQADAGLTNRGNEELRAMLLQLAKRLPRRGGHWREFHQRLSRTKPANVVSAAIANRWLRRLFHEMVAIPKAEAERVDLGSGSANGAHPNSPRPRLDLSS
jgi:transposase